MVFKRNVYIYKNVLPNIQKLVLPNFTNTDHTHFIFFKRYKIHIQRLYVGQTSFFCIVNVILGQPTTSLSMASQRLHHTAPASQYEAGGKLAICGRSEFPRAAFSEGALQWSSESTLEASEIVRRKHNQHKHAIHHHHYFYHHHPEKGGTKPELSERRGYRNGHQRSLSGGSAGQATRPLDIQDGTCGRRVAIQNGFSSRRVMLSKDDIILHQRNTPTKLQPEVHSDTEETAGEVCLECSEWLGRALLCSCQVPSSSSANSSPSQSANAATTSAIGGTSTESHPKIYSDSTGHRSSSRHSSAERSDKSDKIYNTSITPAVVEFNGVSIPHQQTTTAEINVDPQQFGLQSHPHHQMQHQQQHHIPQRTQRVQYQHQPELH